MAIHKVYIEEFEEDDFHIIAIHTSLEDYRLAYFINREIEIRLSKNDNDIQSQVKGGRASFARFTFEDHENAIKWNLVQNKNEVEGSENYLTTDLFSNSNNSFSSLAYLLPEYKKVDFLLKIKNAANEINWSEIVSKISIVDGINMVYNVDKSKIKSKNNLIF